MLENHGAGIAAISYDSAEILKGFADRYSIGFPLLSDHDSAVIRRFGIFNTNIAPGLRAHGVPHPVDYLVAADGTVIRKQRKSDAMLVCKAPENLLGIITDGCDPDAILLQHRTGLFQLDQLGAAVSSPVRAAMKHQQQAVGPSEIRERSQNTARIG